METLIKKLAKTKYSNWNLTLKTSEMSKNAFHTYNEIFKFEKLLRNAGIPYILYEVYDGYQIRLNNKISVIQHCFSDGGELDLLEISGAMSDKELNQSYYLGYLTAENVFKRFCYCYRNKTAIYQN